MLQREYEKKLLRERESRYERLPNLEIAMKVANIMVKRFPEGLNLSQKRHLADQLSITDKSLERLLDLLSENGRYELIEVEKSRENSTFYLEFII
ncbi:hypothetical protein FEFB_13040 [Fructobacillus sp. EFB-N1]|uniref:hypothetical protein n=1 Tax=Fructobacillus sp. EFB-N1 TaxID=1658766 RepID=UPI00064DC596|nr:hypothetical protein [Fructobacillus sp. EFB-N1]KMK52944.1 hypothetical protein FEFB_13040 [Fructobacillus sp. EFB-N1]